MKKIFCALMAVSVFSSVTALAEQVDNSMGRHRPDHEFDLKVEIRNFGTENCQLTKKVLFQGSLYSSDFPSILAATGEIYRFTLRGEETEAQLSYQCGDHKKFTLYMHQYLKRYYHHINIDASMDNAIDVFEKHRIHLANYNDGEYTGELTWYISQ